jgi:hypothetical protein
MLLALAWNGARAGEPCRCSSQSGPSKGVMMWNPRRSSSLCSRCSGWSPRLRTKLPTRVQMQLVGASLVEQLGVGPCPASSVVRVPVFESIVEGVHVPAPVRGHVVRVSRGAVRTTNIAHPESTRRALRCSSTPGRYRARRPSSRHTGQTTYISEASSSAQRVLPRVRGGRDRVGIRGLGHALMHHREAISLASALR